MNKVAEQVFDYLQDKGKVSGGSVRDALSLSKPDWNAAKAELKGAGLVELGRGRGGSIRLISTDKPAPEKKISRADRAKWASEFRQAISKEQKKNNELKDKAGEIVEREFPDTPYWVDIVGNTEAIAYVRVEDESYWQPYRVNFNDA